MPRLSLAGYKSGRPCNYLCSLDPETRVYLLSTDDFRYGTHASVELLSHSFPVTNVSDPVTSLEPGFRAVVIAAPPRADELQTRADAQPGGSLHREDDCDKLMLLAYQAP